MFDTSTPLETPQYAEEDHPKIPKQKIGILVANLGTPDNYDYWSMRRYLNEFFTDRRVIDYSPFLWQPLLQLLILTSRPFRSGAAYKSIWNETESESPLMTIPKLKQLQLRRLCTRNMEIMWLWISVCAMVILQQNHVSDLWLVWGAAKFYFFRSIPTMLGLQVLRLMINFSELS